MTAKPQTSWIPPELRLPSTVELIEAGRTPPKRQRQLFTDDVMTRLRAIKQLEHEDDRR